MTTREPHPVVVYDRPQAVRDGQDRAFREFSAKDCVSAARPETRRGLTVESSFRSARRWRNQHCREQMSRVHTMLQNVQYYLAVACSRVSLAFSLS